MRQQGTSKKSWERCSSCVPCQLSSCSHLLIMITLLESQSRSDCVFVMISMPLLLVLAACLSASHPSPPYLVQIWTGGHVSTPQELLPHGPFSNLYLIPGSDSKPSPSPTWGMGPTDRPEDEEPEASGPVPSQELSLGIGIPCPTCGNLP